MINRGLVIIALAAIGAGTGLMHWYGVEVSLTLCLLLFYCLAAVGIVALGNQSLLEHLYIPLFVAPFTSLAGFLVSDSFTWWQLPKLLSLTTDQTFLSFVVLLGCTGLCGLIVGMLLIRQPTTQVPTSEVGRTMNPLLFCAIVALPLTLSWYSSPEQTLFAARYASIDAVARAESVNFNGGAAASYMVLLLLFIDAQNTIERNSRRFKHSVVLGVSTLIVIWFQLLRGDRDCAGFLLAVCMVYLLRASSRRRLPGWKREFSRRVRLVTVLLVVAFFVFVGIGAARQTLSTAGDRDSVNVGETLSEGFGQLTWSAVLLTNVALELEFRTGQTELLIGKTYADYVLSLPPGIIAHYSDWLRPIDSNGNPAKWYQGITVGGLQPVIVPFKNFGPSGVFFVLLTFGYLIAQVERRYMQCPTFWSEYLYACFGSTSFMWFWYGDMYIVRTLMVWAAAGILYRVIIQKASRVVTSSVYGVANA